MLAYFPFCDTAFNAIEFALAFTSKVLNVHLTTCLQDRIGKKGL